ncbi:MAG TPA: hypothetical protein VGJ81_19350 [Thermoanaerobaculia bacterium]|jgi:hypothetical protein
MFCRAKMQQSRTAFATRKPPSNLLKKRPARSGGKVGHRGLRVDAEPSSLDRRLAHVGAEHLKAGMDLRLFHRLDHDHRDRVNLFTGRAPWDPDPYRVVFGASAQQLHRECAQRREDVGIAKEGRDTDQDVGVEKCRLVRVRFHQVGVVAESLDPQQRHAAPDPPLDRGRLVVGEIDVVRRLENRKNLLQLLGGQVRRLLGIA